MFYLAQKTRAEKRKMVLQKIWRSPNGAILSIFAFSAFDAHSAVRNSYTWNQDLKINRNEERK